MASSFFGGTATVVSAGTPVPLSATSRIVSQVSILTNNTAMYLGGSDVLAASKNGASLSNSRPLTLMARRKGFGGGIDLKDLYVDAAANGEYAIYVAVE